MKSQWYYCLYICCSLLPAVCFTTSLESRPNLFIYILSLLNSFPILYVTSYYVFFHRKPNPFYANLLFPTFSWHLFYLHVRFIYTFIQNIIYTGYLYFCVDVYLFLSDFYYYYITADSPVPAMILQFLLFLLVGCVCLCQSEWVGGFASALIT